MWIAVTPNKYNERAALQKNLKILRHLYFQTDPSTPSRLFPHLLLLGTELHRTQLREAAMLHLFKQCLQIRNV